jgi:hypothetical protein
MLLFGMVWHRNMTKKWLIPTSILSSARMETGGLLFFLVLLSFAATSPAITVSRELLVGLSSQGRTTCVITC